MFIGAYFFNLIGCLTHFIFYNVYAISFNRKRKTFFSIRKGEHYTETYSGMAYESFHNVLGIVVTVFILLLIVH